MAGKREKHLVAHVQHARGFGVNRQDCVARHRGGIDGKRRGRQQREQKCDERLLGGVALKPDNAGSVARSRCGEIGILHSPKSLSRNLPKRDRFILAGFIWGNVTVLSSLPSEPPQRCLSPLWWFWWLGVQVDALGLVAATSKDDERQARDYERQAQQLTHGDNATQQIAQLCIGHAHKLN